MYKVLLVDDDRFARFDLKRFKKWSQYGFSIAGEAEDGYEALQKLETETFDLAFVDIRMPRIDGICFLTALRKKDRSLCVIIVSGYSDFEYARQGFKLGAFDYLIKPVEEKSLCSLLDASKKHLDERNAQRPEFQFPYSVEEENNLLSAVNGCPERVIPAAEALIQKMVRFSGGDFFHLDALLSSSWKSLLEKLLKQRPYLTQICTIGPFPELLKQGKSPDAAVFRYQNDLLSLSEQILNLNLNHRSSVIRLFCEYALIHLDQDISLESAAKEIGYSGKYISRVFKEKTGISCVAYLTRLKMQRAANLVLSGKYKNYEISKMLGYKTPDYFCSLFKKHYGMTPMEYRADRASKPGKPW